MMATPPSLSTVRTSLKSRFISPRLDKARAKEEAQKKAEQEEADAERSNRRDKYYRDNGDKLTKARPSVPLSLLKAMERRIFCEL